MSDKKPTSPLFAWFEAGLGLVADQVTQANQQVQQTLSDSQQTLNEFASRGEQVESQLRKAVDPAQWCEVWRQSPLHHWMPSFTTPKQKRAAQLDVLSNKVDLLVEQVALLAAKQAAAKAEAAAAKPAPKTRRKPAASKAASESGTKTAAKTTTTRKTTTRKPAASKAKTTPPKQD